MIANATSTAVRRLLPILLLALAAPVQAVTPLGAPFTITPTPEPASLHASARSASGSFVVAWSEDRSTPSVGQGELLLQRYSASGLPQGAPFPVDPAGGYEPRHPALAMDAAGGFVAVWVVIGPDAFPNRTSDIYSQRFAANGSRIGAIQHVANVVDYNIPLPAVAMNAGGSFVVAWQTMIHRPVVTGVNSVNTTITKVHARRYGSDGLARGATIEVDSGLPLIPNLTQYPNKLAVGIDDSGAFAVAFEASIGAYTSIQLRRYDADGTARGLRQRVNPLANQFGTFPDLLMNGDGSFVVSWCKCQEEFVYNSAGYFQRFDAEGRKQGGATLVANSGPGTRGSSPRLARGPDNSFTALIRVATVADHESYLQAYRADGMPEGASLLLQEDVTQRDRDTRISGDANGDLLATWHNSWLNESQTAYIDSLRGRLFLRQ